MVCIVPMYRVLEDNLYAVSTTTVFGRIGPINSFRTLQKIVVSELSMMNGIPSVSNENALSSFLSLVTKALTRISGSTRCFLYSCMRERFNFHFRCLGFLHPFVVAELSRWKKRQNRSREVKLMVPVKIVHRNKIVIAIMQSMRMVIPSGTLGILDARYA